MSSFKLQPHLHALLKSLSTQPVTKGLLDDLVQTVLTDTKDIGTLENRKSQWEYLLKLEIFNVAATEGTALKTQDESYHDRLRDRLDLILTFAEHDACDQGFPFSVLQDLLETQTISSCSHIFSWLESRSPRLIKDMVPQKGKALNLLRMLNDLLRRLSKTGAATTFCGRILIFLSGVFPPGERSGVNLRGEYGPPWEAVVDYDKQSESSGMGEDKNAIKTDDDSPDKMEVDEGKPVDSPSAADKKGDFYRTFWSLQTFFARPSTVTTPGKFAELQEAVNTVLPVLKEAAAKERLMMGSRLAAAHGGSLKRKRDSELPDDVTTNDYFFAKFLTSPDLLDLEIADTHFRRQILFQLIILLNHLLNFTKTAKATWATPRNRSLQMDFELTDAQWVQETIVKAMEELKQGGPGGRAFAETVSVIMERERNWVKWKNEMCNPFDKPPWSMEVGGKKVGLMEATREARAKLREPPKPWDWALGSEALTEIWEMGYRDLSDLQSPFQPGDVKDFVKKVKLEDHRIAMRKKQLQQAADRLAARVAAQSKAASPATPTPEQKEQQLAPAVTLKPPETSSPAPPVATLHPSLPAKPGSSPARPLSSASKRPSTEPAGPSVTPLAAAAQPTPAAASPASTPAPTASVPKSLVTDELIQKYEENKTRWAWLTLRTARDQYLQHFGKIGTGDIVLLAQEIEKEKEQQHALKLEDATKSEETPSVVAAGVAVEDPAGNVGSIDDGKALIDAVPKPREDVEMSESGSTIPTDTNRGTDVEGDAKMEDR